MEGLEILKNMKRISPNSKVYKDLWAIATTPDTGLKVGDTILPGIFSAIYKGQQLTHIWVNDKNIVIQPNYYQGTKKWTKLVINRYRYTLVLNQLGIKYKIYRSSQLKSAVHDKILIPIQKRY